MNQSSGIHFNQTHQASDRHSESNAAQRWGAIVGGGALAVYGLTRRSMGGIALATAGGVIALLGARANFLEQEAIARSTVLLNCSPEEAYRFWTDFEQLPLFMHHIESVTEINDRQSRWIAIGPLGTRITWNAEITDEREGKVIAWRSLPDSEIEVDGVVEFSPAPAGRGTYLTAIMRYRPPAGAVGNAVAKMLGKDPNFLMRQDLRRLKALIEAGEIPTTEGQTHGPRSVVAGVARVIDPDRPIRGDVDLTEFTKAKRRVA
jgi:uncharacterized membrane protein